LEGTTKEIASGTHDRYSVSIAKQAGEIPHQLRAPVNFPCMTGLAQQE
jgi:hypothetical protein